MKENRTLHRGKAGKNFLFQYPKMPFFGSLIHPNSKSSQSQKNIQNHLNRHRKKQNHKKRGKRESRTVGLLGWTAREISTVCFFLQIVTLLWERREKKEKKEEKHVIWGWWKWRSFSSDGWKERRYSREVTSEGAMWGPRDDLFIGCLLSWLWLLLLLWEIKAEQRCSRPGEELKDLKLKEGIWFFFLLICGYFYFYNFNEHFPEEEEEQEEGPAFLCG